MEVIKAASAGTLESNDCLIMVAKGDGLKIELNSPVKKQFGDQIISTIEKTVDRLDVNNIYIKVQDKGALDCTIEARCEAAIRRACNNQEYVWEAE